MSDTIIPSTEKKLLRYDFTAPEIHDLSMQLANENRKLNGLKEEKKSVNSQWTASINASLATVNKLSNQVADGYEFREVECEVQFHKPEQGKKTYKRKDGGPDIVEKMTTVDWNLFTQAANVGKDDHLEEDGPF